MSWAWLKHSIKPCSFYNLKIVFYKFGVNPNSSKIKLVLTFNFRKSLHYFLNYENIIILLQELLASKRFFFFLAIGKGFVETHEPATHCQCPQWSPYCCSTMPPRAQGSWWHHTPPRPHRSAGTPEVTAPPWTLVFLGDKDSTHHYIRIGTRFIPKCVDQHKEFDPSS